VKRAIFIVGPTAVGKTDLAFKISKNVPSVLISADSVQVYRGADIISGKDNSVPTHLLDILPPTKSFSVHDFVERGHPIIEMAQKQRKIPIIVGGTWFYSDALFKKIDTLYIPPDEALRKHLSNLTVKKLQEKLKNVNSEHFLRMNKSDANNKRRLIRAIEVSKYGRMTARTLKDLNPIFKKNDVLIIGLRTSMRNLKERIRNRVEKRIETGALWEARKLFKNYKKLSLQLKTANGYKELFDYLLGKTTLEEARERWVTADYRHAKNQMTWFKRNKDILWFDPVRNSKERILKEVLSLIRNNLNISNGVCF
jgi:tRNA dimethylallyltransferase